MLLMEHCDWVREKSAQFINYFRAYLKTMFRQPRSVDLVLKTEDILMNSSEDELTRTVSTIMIF